MRSGAGRAGNQLRAFNMARWLQDNRHLLVPPVGNKLLHDGDDFSIMMVAGPNSRTDYHVEEGEEWFYQLQGSMTLKVVDPRTAEFYDVPISEGDTFLLPPRWPHSPQRDPGSIGLVVERKRREGELDILRWYCGNAACRNLVYQERFVCNDLVKDLPPIINRYYTGDTLVRTCSKCGWEELPPERYKAATTAHG